ncbi:MAG: NADH-quinone oxidoreductase subunit C [Desulfobacula sp.]|jgi:NADH-quinone oxidoreductase subunit C
MMQDNTNKNEMLEIEAWSKNLTDYSKTGFHSNYFVDTDKILPSVNYLKEIGFFLEDLTGVDVKEGIMLVYHFDRLEHSSRITLRAIVGHDLKVAPSIVSIYKGADWHERECFDFFGVRFENHPNLKPLLLPDDLGIHPLLKEKDRKSVYTLLDFNMLADNKR